MVLCIALLRATNEHIRQYKENRQWQLLHFAQDVHRMGSRILAAQSAKITITNNYLSIISSARIKMRNFAIILTMALR